MPVPTAALGRTQLLVSRLGFGCSTIASLATRYATAEVQAALLEAMEQGVNFFDTADVYGQGDSERLLGRLAAGRKLVICTKVGMRLAHSEHAIRWVKPLLQPLLRRYAAGRARTRALRRASERQCFDPAYLTRRVDASLRRLRTERLDLLLLHSPPPEVAERCDVLELLRRLVHQGKLRWFGVSVAELAHARAWAAWPGLSCLQLPLTPIPCAAGFGLPPETTALLAELDAQGIGLIAREIFGGGALAADAASRIQALAAVLSAPGVAVALAGMGNRAHLEDNLRALAQVAASFAPR